MSLMKKAIGGSIHRIREFELEKVNLIDEFDILQIVGEGWFGKILLTEHRSTQTEMVLKLLPKAYTGISDFFREFHYGLHLAAHRNVITTYDVAFETAGFYVFSQEYAPLGDLTSNVTETGLGELHAKRVARQLAAAVHHIHSRELVHRDIKLDNILVFKSDFSRIKLCDFGETRRVNTVVRRHNEWLPYSPPEVLQIDTDETYKALTSHDVWQFGIVLFVCLTGCLPWQKAALDDPRYTRYQNWHNATLNIAKKPKLFQLISSRAQRMFKRLLDPKAEKRPVSVLEVNKYLEDRWLAKLGAEKALNGGADERDELCPSMYSFHSSAEEKNQLLYTLTTYGIETTVDRAKKKDRIRKWIQSSAIVEEMEEEESDFTEDADYLEDDDDEPHTMRGRHFPERRPSTMSDDVKRRNSKNGLSVPKRQPMKPSERKIPFAPQVAEEREIVARYASFPNGDPNLALSKNGSNGANGTLETGKANGIKSSRSKSNPNVDFSADSGKPIKNVSTTTNGRVAENSSNSGRVSRENSTSGYGSDPNTTSDTVSTEIPKSPQAPIRKHRAQTAPFPVPTTPRLESSRKSQSAAVLSKSRTESSPLSNSQVEKANITNSHVRRNEKPPISTSGTTNVNNNNNNHSAPLSDAENSSTLPTIPQLAPAQNSLTMSVASQLVMQSFNALQNLNPSPCSLREAPSRNTTPPMKTNPEETYTYGKDAYEHYGIAQGVVFRMESTRRGSSGSASRSVSN